MPTYICKEHGIISFGKGMLKPSKIVICKDYIFGGCRKEMKKLNDNVVTISDYSSKPVKLNKDTDNG